MIEVPIRKITPMCKFCEHCKILRNGRYHCKVNKKYPNGNDPACEKYITTWV